MTKEFTKEMSAKIARGITIDTTKLPGHKDYILIDLVNNPIDGRQPLTLTEKILIWLCAHKMGFIVTWYYKKQNKYSGSKVFDHKLTK